MTDSNLLRAKIIEKGFTQTEIATKLGISAQSLNYKINNKREFKASEIEKLCGILGIKNKNSYFFS